MQEDFREFQGSGQLNQLLACSLANFAARPLIGPATLPGTLINCSAWLATRSAAWFISPGDLSPCCSMYMPVRSLLSCACLTPSPSPSLFLPCSSLDPALHLNLFPALLLPQHQPCSGFTWLQLTWFWLVALIPGSDSLTPWLRVQFWPLALVLGSDSVVALAFTLWL